MEFKIEKNGRVLEIKELADSDTSIYPGFYISDNKYGYDFFICGACIYRGKVLVTTRIQGKVSKGIGKPVARYPQSKFSGLYKTLMNKNSIWLYGVSDGKKLHLGYRESLADEYVDVLTVEFADNEDGIEIKTNFEDGDI